MEANEYIWRNGTTGQVITHCYGITEREMLMISQGIHFGLLHARRRNGSVNVYAVTTEGEKIAHSFRLTSKSK